MSTNWSKRGKETLAAVPLTVPQKVDYGPKYEAVLDKFEPAAFKTGSIGVILTFTVEDQKYPLREYIVLKTLDKNGAFQNTQYGESSLKRRLQAFGLTADEVNSFPIPASPKAESELYGKLAGTNVVVYLKDDQYINAKGVMTQAKKIRSVFPVDR